MLYEVITISGITMAQTFNWQEQVLTERGENMQDMGIAEDGSATIVRITSYNVCYTKLLRICTSVREISSAI